MRARGLLAGLLIAGIPSAAWADKVTRTVNEEGVPKISIRGQARSAPVVEEAPATAPKKEFQVYELDGQGAPAPEPATQVVIIASPPPIAPNPAAFGYGYGYGYGYDYGFGYGWGPSYPCNYPVGQPLNYQPAPLNYQNPPINYQTPPLNYQARPVGPGLCAPRRR